MVSRCLSRTLLLASSPFVVACSNPATGDAEQHSTGGTGGDASSGTGGDGMGGSSGALNRPGCGKQNPAVGDLTMDLDGTQAHYIVTLPTNYDPTVALPLVFGFHGANRTAKDCQLGDCWGLRTALRDKAVLVYMKSPAGPGWTGPDEVEPSVKFFEETLRVAKESYCVDETRVFVAGTSSGANFANVLACRHGDLLRGVIPVAGSMPEAAACPGKGPVPALLIHGVDDDKVPLSDGIAARGQYRAWNGCSEQSVPEVPALHDRVTEERESHECAEYQGCKEGFPVVWCEHSEGGYDGSTHGWPKFGGEEIARFIERF